MDKLLLDALSNLSLALEKLNESLNKRNESKSPSATALQSGNFVEQLSEINKSIIQLKEDNKKILDNQETIIKLQKQQKDGKTGIISDAGKSDNKKMLKDGISVIVLIAGAVLAIGLAFKILGDVNWKSVISISIALPLIAFAFEKIGKMKDLTPGKVILIGLSLVGISIAMVLSSRILKNVVPISMFQALTVVFIATAFGAAAFGLGNLLRSFKDLRAVDALKASVVLPIVLVAVSLAIALSSVILKKVQPIGLFQAFTVVLIAAAFGVVSFGLGKLLSAFKDLSVGSAITAAFLMPIVLVALSYAIVEASKLFKNIQIIGLFQAFTAILISGVFVVLSYSIGPLMKGVKGVTLGQLAIGTLAIIALSGAIVAVSHLLMFMAPISIGTILKFGLTSIVISASTVVLALSVKAVSKIGTVKEYISGGTSMVILASSLMISSILIASGNYTNYPSLLWTLFAGLSIVGFGLVSFVLNKLGTVGDFIKGGLSIVVLAGVIMITSQILAVGDYTKFPNLDWTIGVSVSILAIGLLSASLGLVVMSGVGLVVMAAGSVAILGIAGLMVLVDSILSTGSFSRYPGSEWAKGVGGSLLLFSMAVVVLGVINSVGGVAETLSFGLVDNPIDAGIESIVKIAMTMVLIDSIISSGNYSKFPTMEWVKSSSNVIYEFAKNMVMYASIFPFLLVGIQLMKGIVETINYIDLIFTMGQYSKYPSEKWVSSTTSLIDKFSKLCVSLSQSVAFVISGEIAVRMVVKMISWIDMVFFRGKFTKYPNEVWQRGSTSTISRFANLIKDIRRTLGFADLIFGSMKVIDMAKSILKIDEIFEKGKFKTFPNKEWVDGSMYALREVVKLVSEQSILGAIIESIADFFGVGGKSSILKVADGILQIDTYFSKGKFMSFPSKSWIDGIKYSLIEVTKMLGDKSFIDPIKSLASGGSIENVSQLAKSIGNVSKAFATSDFTKFPRAEWINGTIYALQKFKDIVAALNSSEFESGGFGSKVASFFGSKTPLESAISNITSLAIAFDQLGNAVNTLSNSINGLSVEKLALVKGMANNVVMFSLMDPGMLDSVLSKIEEKGGVFAQLVKDFEEKKASSATGAAVRVSSATPPKKTDAEILGEKVDAMTAILADISSVVGSKGALKNYLSSIKEKQLAGAGNEPNTINRSDKRSKNILNQIGISNLGINIYEFVYKFDPNTIYQGVIAQELIGTQFENALVVDQRGMYAVDYSMIDVEFKKI